LQKKPGNLNLFSRLSLRAVLAGFWFVGVLVSSALISPGAAAEGPMDIIKINSGSISGVSLEGGVHAFKGIPFAAPPVGNLRWRPPQQVAPWNGVRKCLQYGPACPQPDLSSTIGARFSNQSEDCLYVNVWTPATSPAANLPVMVWIHGGAFIVDDSSNPLYDGKNLARKGVVVVSINYRLGPYGFLAHPRLSQESSHHVSGNYGFLDQIVALKWVRDNIKAFGGDPNKVTIFGESAGARSVALLMVSPLSKGLFQQGILESRTVFTPIYDMRQSWYGRPSMEHIGELIAQRLGCDKASDPIACMRSKSAQEILSAAKPTIAGLIFSEKKGFPFEPIVDGWAIPEDPSDMFDAGRQARIPIIAGSNRDEATLFTSKMKIDPTRAQAIVRFVFPRHADKILHMFPMKTTEEARTGLNNIFGDMGSIAPIRATLRDMDKIGARTWRYYFTRVRPDSRGQRFEAYHGCEIQYVFETFPPGPLEAVDRQVADAITGAWVRFAATGDPNGGGLPQWPAYNRSAGSYLEFGNQIRVGQHLRTPASDLFQQIEMEQRANRRNQPPLMEQSARQGSQGTSGETLRDRIRERIREKIRQRIRERWEGE
jgi:para-nitrobenzyl esterase